MSKENRLKVYQKLVLRGRKADIPPSLLEEFAPKEPVVIKKKKLFKKK